MGSSDSTEFPPLVPLLLGDKVDLSRLSPAEAVALLRGFFAHLQPCHKYLPAKTIGQLTERVKPLSHRQPDLPQDHVFWQPVKLRGVHKREKCVDLEINMGFVDFSLRDAHDESHHDLLWTRGGELAVVSYYHSNEVGGTVAMDIVAATDEQLKQVFCFGGDLDYLRGKRWREIVIATLAIVRNMLEERQALVDRHHKLLKSAVTLSEMFTVPPEPQRQFRL